MENVDSSETSRYICHAIRCQIPEESGRQLYSVEKLQPHMEIEQVFRQTNKHHVMCPGFCAVSQRTATNYKFGCCNKLASVSLHSRRWVTYPSAAAGVARHKVWRETLLQTLRSYSLVSSTGESQVRLELWRCLLPFGGRPNSSLSLSRSVGTTGARQPLQTAVRRPAVQPLQ